MKTFDEYLKAVGEVGKVEQVLHDLVYVNGLPNVRLNELIVFETGEVGRVFSITTKILEVLVFTRGTVRVGTRAARTSEFLQIPVGDDLLGQTVDPLGQSLERLKSLKKTTEVAPVDVKPPDIYTRKRISKPCDTGVALVDLIVPLGKGQRELIIGDRKTGKTSLLVQTLLTQGRQGAVCIYAAIGKKKIDIKKMQETFVKTGVKNLIIVASSLQDPAGIIFLTPYSAMTIAEYFRDKGKDVLLVLDDLSTHARFYREIALLGKRFPGRNSYPGDIFYTHARLLERAGNFAIKDSEASITCLPVAEATQGDLTGYIQTNIMSMTDGHIYFDNDLFSKGRRPAINPFLSVTRVGHQTQTTLRRDINRELMSFLTLFEKLQRFIHFGAELSQSIKQTLSTGEQILAFFDQTSDTLMDQNLQVFMFSLLWIGVWQDKTVAQMREDMQKILGIYLGKAEMQKQIFQMVQTSNTFNEFLNSIRKQMNQMLPQIIKQPEPAPEAPAPVKPMTNTQQLQAAGRIEKKEQIQSPTVAEQKKK